jgi:hypothetical protein
MQSSLKTALLVTTGISLAVGTWISGSSFWFIVTLLFLIAGLNWITILAVSKRAEFPVFSAVFALVCWVGLIQSLRAPFPISGVPLWQSMYWSVTQYGSSWLGFNASVYLAITYLCWTLLIALFGGLVAQLLYVLIRRLKDTPPKSSCR